MIVGMLDGSAEVRIILGGQDAQIQRERLEMIPHGLGTSHIGFC